MAIVKMRIAYAATAWCTGIVSVLLPLAQAAGAAPGVASSGLRMRVLALADRTSLVLDMDEVPSQVKTNRVDASNLVVEVGPVRYPLAPRALKPDTDVPLLASVSVAQSSADQNRLRVRLTFDAGTEAVVRSAGKRVYIDLAPKLTTTGKPSPEVPLKPAAQREAAVARMAASRPPADLWSLGYQELADQVSELAAALAKRPDVPGLIALRSRVVDRDDQLGHQSPALMTRVLAEIDHQLDEARRLRLKLDAAELGRAGRGARK